MQLLRLSLRPGETIRSPRILQLYCDGIVLAFRREQSPYASYDCELREIEPSAQYEVVLSSSYQPSPPLRTSGEKLRRFRAVIDEKPGSLLVEYRMRGRTASSSGGGGFK